MHQHFIDLKTAYGSIWREVLYNILIEFGIPIKLVRLIKMCLTELYSRAGVGKNLSDMFPIRNGLKQGDALRPLLSVAYPGILFGEGVQQIQLRTEDREKGDLGAVAP